MKKVIELPKYLEKATDEIIRSHSSKKWVNSAIELSNRYRGERCLPHKSIASSRDEVLGYCALRMPAIFAQVSGTLNQTNEVLENFKPESVLDLGCGPGTASFAAIEFFPSVREVTFIEKEPEFLKVSRQFVSNLETRKVNFKWEKFDLTQRKLPTNLAKHDIVILSNVLNELSEEESRRVIDFALDLTGKLLIIVEAGTEFGQEVLNTAINILLTKHGNFIAPFVKGSPYYSNNTWTHFSQKIKRTSFQRAIKKQQRDSDLAPSDFEEAKYSYLAFSPNLKAKDFWARLILPPKKVKGFMELTLLTKDKIIKERVLKRHKDKYNSARKLNWGDLILDDLTGNSGEQGRG